MLDNIIFLGFADNKVPEFKEVNSKEWVLFGEDNKFPDHLLYLYNKSSNHNAIVNGKSTYILGKGFQIGNTRLEKVNRHGESFNKVIKKFTMDIELFGGAYLEVIWDRLGQNCELFHLPFQCLRKAKEGNGFWHRKDWSAYKRDQKFIPLFDLNERKGSQVFAYGEYRPGVDQYPLPGYFGALNDIETDVEISKYYLSVMKNGQFTGKIINFFDGKPSEEEKKVLERKWNNKFNGSENAGKTMLTFNAINANAPIVTDISSSDLDKLFEQLNKNTQGEIFSGHLVTSPLLFGIQQAGALGNRNELQDAYEIFKNTYINEKQQNLEEIAEIFTPLFGVQIPLKIQPVDPIGFKPTDSMIEAAMTKNEVREVLGLKAIEGADNVPDVAPVQQGVNENVKNLTGRQNQQLLRIIKQYEKQKLTKEQAATLLKTSLALGDEEIDILLKSEQFDAEYTEFEVADMFEAVGESSDDFIVVKKKAAKFEKEEMFADIKQNDSNILDLIKKDKRITPQVIGKTLNLDPSYVSSRIKALEQSGILIPVSKNLGIDTIIERAINPEGIDTRLPAETVDVYVKYSYEPLSGLKPIIDTTRPFCKKLIELDRLYTRGEIESISSRVGYSVWDRRGGFWGDSPTCRHRWVSNIVVKKRK